MRIPFFGELFRKTSEPRREPQAPTMKHQLVVGSAVCHKCRKRFTTYRTYGDGRMLCVPCATEAEA